MPHGSKKGSVPRLRRPRAKGPRPGPVAGARGTGAGAKAGAGRTGAEAGAGGTGARAGGTGAWAKAGAGGTGTRVGGAGAEVEAGVRVEAGAEAEGERTGETGAGETGTEAPSTTDAAQERLTMDKFLPNVDREENQEPSSQSAVRHPVQDNCSQETTGIKSVPLMSLKVDPPAQMSQRVDSPPLMSQRDDPPPLMSLKVDPPPFLFSRRNRNHPVRRDFSYPHYTGPPFFMDHWRARPRSPVPKNKIPLLSTPSDPRHPTVSSPKVETPSPPPQLDKIVLPLSSGIETLPTSVEIQSLCTQHAGTHRLLPPEASLAPRNLPSIDYLLMPQPLPINSMITPPLMPRDTMPHPVEPLDTSLSFRQRAPHVDSLPVIKSGVGPTSLVRSSAPYLNPSYKDTLHDMPPTTVPPNLMPLFPEELTINPQFLGSQGYTSSPRMSSSLHIPSLNTPTVSLPPEVPACAGVSPSMALNTGYPFSPQSNTRTSPFNLQQVIPVSFMTPGIIPPACLPPTCPSLISSGFLPPLHPHLMLSDILTPSRLHLGTSDIHSISPPHLIPPYIHSLFHSSLMSPGSLFPAHSHPICPHMLPFSHHPQILPDILSFPSLHQNSQGVRSFSPPQPISPDLLSLSPPHLVSTDILSFSHPPLMSPDIMSPSHTHSMSPVNQCLPRTYINSPGTLFSSSLQATSQDVAFSHFSSRTSPDIQLHLLSSQNSTSISSHLCPFSTSPDVQILSSGAIRVEPHLMSLNAEPPPPPPRVTSSPSSSLSISLPCSTFQNIQPTSSEDLKIEHNLFTPLYSKPISPPPSDTRTTSSGYLRVTTPTCTSLQQTLPPQELINSETSLPESHHVVPFPVKFRPDNALFQTQPKIRRTPSSKPLKPIKPRYAEALATVPKDMTSRKSKSARVKLPPFRPPRFSFPQGPLDIPPHFQTPRKMRFPPVESWYTQPPSSAPMDMRGPPQKSRKVKRPPYNNFEMGFRFSNSTDVRSVHRDPVQARLHSINLQNVNYHSNYLRTMSPDIPTPSSKHSKAGNPRHSKPYFPSKPKKNKTNPKKNRQIQYHPVSCAGPSCLPQSTIPPSTRPGGSKNRSKRLLKAQLPSFTPLRDNPTHPVLPGGRYPPFESYRVRHPPYEPFRVRLPSLLESTDNQHSPRECSDIEKLFPKTSFHDKSSSPFTPEASRS